jgi:S-DNA-T family DNA segregation ATPase FtsK/SpoIIIE
MLETGPEVSITETETTEVAKCIEETLQHHGVEVAVNQVKPGPTVTLYGLTPGWVRRVRDVRERDDQDQLIRDAAGKPVVSRKEEQTRVKVDSITAREKDLALALATPSLRIQAPVPGESIVGIEVPNRNPVLVSLRSVLEAGTVQDMARKNGLPLALGQGSGGDAVVVDLRKLPHLLIAGATGSGKSVCINTVIVSLLTQMPPDQLRLLLIDPKRVELTPFNGIPHLVTPVVVEADEAVTALKGIRREMLRRYKLLEEVGVRNVDGYRSHPRATEPMPYLVIAIDELADLMMSAPYDVEQTLTRLAQLGRATGIHLIVATQRPSVDVVTGLIKANFPSRLSFAVVSQVDSRTILDSGGAERLLGKGDMLFLSTDTPKPQRVQGAYLSDREIERVVEFWQDQHGPPLPQLLLEPEPEDQAGSSNGSDRSGPQDELLDKAIELASRYSHVSTSLLQRRLRIGYPRAARLMDQLEDEGVIGTGEPGKSREVLGTGG